VSTPWRRTTRRAARDGRDIRPDEGFLGGADRVPRAAQASLGSTHEAGRRLGRASQPRDACGREQEIRKLLSDARVCGERRRLLQRCGCGKQVPEVGLEASAVRQRLDQRDRVVKHAQPVDRGTDVRKRSGCVAQ
jgi:hypothetical protein